MKTTKPDIAPLGILICAFLLTLALPVLGAANDRPPELISYQGFLTDANDDVIGASSVATHAVEFRIYANSQGGTALWGEEQTVAVDKGYFSVLLGQGSALSGVPNGNLSDLFNAATASDRFIGITVADISSTEVAPRLRFAPAPYAFLARHATQLSDGSGASLIALDGSHGVKVSEDLIVREPGENFAIRLSPSTGGIGANPELVIQPSAGTAGTDADFHISLNAISGAASQTENYIDAAQEASQIRFHKDGDLSFRTAPANGGDPITWSTRLHIQRSNGNIGIGRTSPSAKLDVNGTVKATTFDGALANSMVTSASIASNAVTAAKIAAGAVGVSELAVGAVTSAKIQNETIVDVDLAPESVGWTKIKADAVRSSHINNGAVKLEDLNTEVGAFTASGDSWTTPSGIEKIGIGVSNPLAMLNIRRLPGSSEWPLVIEKENGGNILMVNDDNKFGYLGTHSLTDFNVQGSSNEDNVFRVTKANGDSIFRVRHDKDVLVNGTLKVNGATVTGSDRRLKTDIEPLPASLSGVLKLRPSRYRLKSDGPEGERHIGFIAQEVREQFPELVGESEGFLALDYNAFGVLAIQAIQEQQAQISKRDARIAALESRLAALERTARERESRLGALEKGLERLTAAREAAAADNEIASR